MKAVAPVFQIVRSADRAYVDHEWLRTYHSFSFAEYFDPLNLNWGALRVFNEDTIAGGTGFPAHSHRDMEIVTYILAGALEHQDSMGNRGVVKPGGVQFMSAGTGVRHSEYNALPDEELHLVQMWVMPGKVGVPASYGQLDFTEDDRRNRWLVCVSGEDAVQSQIRITQNATLRVARLEDVELAHDFAKERFGYVFVASGELNVNGERLRAGDAARTYDIPNLTVRGTGELVFWDLPPAPSE
jgi:redox-sensitive bicupin YhaK (pirin superfamily)